jgi:hypothetical protein
MSQRVHQYHHTDCLGYSVGNIQSNCNKRTYLRSPIAMLLCCELCQAIQIHRRYTDRLLLYRHVRYPWMHSFPKLYLQTRIEIADGLRTESNFETDNGGRINVYLNQLTLLSVWEDSIVLSECMVTTAWMEHNWVTVKVIYQTVSCMYISAI